jgi:hypothetical protein
MDYPTLHAVFPASFAVAISGGRDIRSPVTVKVISNYLGWVFGLLLSTSLCRLAK